MTVRMFLLLLLVLGRLLPATVHAATPTRKESAVVPRAGKIPGEAARAGSRGYLTTPQELKQIRVKAGKGVEPYRSAVQEVLHDADQPWIWPAPSGRLTCPSADEPAYLKKGSKLIYAKALAYQLTGQEHYAEEVQTRIGALLAIVSFGDPGNSREPDRRCQLVLSWSIPGFIRAADLLEDNPQWRSSGIKARFQTWLT